MTRFLYITDSHVGGDTEGFAQQVRLPQLTATVLGRLGDWLAENPVDFVLHGGDMTDLGAAAQITLATDLFAKLDTPVFLCLGNHDLTLDTSVRDWLTLGGQFFPTGAPTYRLIFDEMLLLVVAHHWRSDLPLRWTREGPMAPRLDESQREQVESMLAAADRPVVLALHAPLNPIPMSQTGLDRDIHEVDPAWSGYFRQLADRYPQLKLALAGHNHANTLARLGNLTALTTGAILESPFESRLIEANHRSLRVTTLSLGPLLDLHGPYLPEKAWVQGDAAIRECELTW